MRKAGEQVAHGVDDAGSYVAGGWHLDRIHQLMAVHQDGVGVGASDVDADEHDTCR